MSPLEIAVYVAVMSSAAQPFTCTGPGQGEVTCDNGMSATLNGDGDIAFSNGTIIRKLADGTLAMTNGITSHWGSAGWVQFSNKVSVRRDRNGRFRFNTGLECAPLGRDGHGRETAACTKV
ncbi:MAG: hypothetical protein RLY86_2008 [Pseudomonadota bacterium]|jgi:hypothetical protein